MGSFSFLKADHCTKQRNLVLGDSYKILVPAKLGGGYIKDKYWDYGYINHYHIAVYVDSKGYKYPLGDLEADLYGLLAWFNTDNLSYQGTLPTNILDILLRGNTHSDTNRHAGIEMGCYDNQVNALQYPLKLVSARCKDTYESCKGRSYGDPDQGFKRTYWE